MTEHDLGALVRSYPSHKHFRRPGGRLVASLGVVVGAVTIYLLLSQTIQATSFVLLTVTSALMLVFGLRRILLGRLERHERFDLYEGGFVRTTEDGRVVFPWPEVKSIRHKRDHTDRGVQSYRGVVVRKDGVECTWEGVLTGERPEWDSEPEVDLTLGAEHLGMAISAALAKRRRPLTPDGADDGPVAGAGAQEDGDEPQDHEGGEPGPDADKAPAEGQ
jgi:hypothetical protein